MQDGRDEAPDSPQPTPSAPPAIDRSTGTLVKPASRLARYRALAIRFWRWAPSYPERASWRELREACARTLCCGAVLLATLAHIQPLAHVDLYPTYVAAHLANEGRWDRIYHRTVWVYGTDPEWDQKAQSLIHAPLHGTAFVYHPWYLMAARPLAASVSYESFQRGSVLFNKLCVVLTGLGIALLLRWNTLAQQLFLTLIVGVAATTIYGIDFGQNVMPAMACSLAAAVAWRSRAPLYVGGTFAALAWTCKPWCAALLLLCFLLRGPRAGMLSAGVLALVMIGLPSLLLPDVLMRDYHAMNLSLASISVLGWNNLSVLSILERFRYPDWSVHLYDWFPRKADRALRVGAFGVSAGVFATAALIWWRRRPSPDWTAAAWLAFMLMPLGICWTHYFVFAFPLAFVAGLSERSPPVLRVLGLSLLAVLMAITITYDVTPAEYHAYLAQPARYPWLRSIPMLLVACCVLGALWFAPAARADDGV